MNRRERRVLLSRLGRSVGFRLLAVVIVLYIIYQCVAATSQRIATEVVTLGQDDILLTGEGTIFREETVLTASGGRHLCSYAHPDGAKVGSNATLALLFTTGEDTETLRETQARLNALDERMRALDTLSNTTDTLALLPTLSTQARDTLLSTARDITSGASMQDIAAGAAALIQTIGRIDVLTGRIPSLSALRATVSTERQALLMAAGRAGRTLTVADIPLDTDHKSGGWFYYGDHVDGYENIMTAEALSSLSAASLAQLRATPPDEYGSTTVVGKLVTDRYWSLAVPVTSEAAALLEIGEEYTVRLPDEADGQATVTMQLERITGSPLESERVLILRADTAPAGFRYTRFCRVELTLDTVSGYRLPTTAIRQTTGDEVELFILDGGRVEVRYAHILARGEGYVIVYAPTAEERQDEQDETYHTDRYVSPGDILITDDGGRDLHDGMYVD